MSNNPPPSNKPLNVLWISYEDSNPRLGCYGDSAARTPNTDRLASEGCIFPNAFSTAGVCAPSRCSIITGVHATTCGAHHMRTVTNALYTDGMKTPYQAVPPHHVKCFTEYLRAAGYYCTNNGKTDYNFGAPSTAWDENWDCFPKEFDGTPGKAHWRNRAPGQPFFAVFNLNNSHECHMWDPDKWHDQPDDTTKTDPESVTVPPYLPDTPKTRKAIARHYDALETNDTVAGKILSQLEEDGLNDNTLVFLWSDHGAGLPRSKRELYDSGIHIPLIVRAPGWLTPGTRDERLVSLIDLAPTVMSLLGFPIPQHFQGSPFMGENAINREYIFASKDRIDGNCDYVRASRSQGFKYLRNYLPNRSLMGWSTFQARHPVAEELWRRAAEGTQSEEEAKLFQLRAAEELYDITKDPWELHNLAQDPAYAETLTAHRKALDAWRSETGDLGDLPENELAERFFPGGKQPITTPPHIVPVGPYQEGRTALLEDQIIEGPCMLLMESSTQGASVTWRLDEDPEGKWRLYTTPIRVEKGTRLKIRAKAIRYGYAESKPTRLRLKVQ